jgi:hypothetical protein
MLSTSGRERSGATEELPEFISAAPSERMS